MRSICACALAVLVACCLLAPAVQARDIYVAIAGNNSWPGTSAQPYRTIKYAVSQSVNGDRILVRAGTYPESWIYVKGGTELVSVDALWAAKIYGAGSSVIRLEQSNSGIDGFEIYGDWNQGNPGDGLVRPLNSTNVWVKNCLVHDAPYDCDVIKIGANNVLIENCVVYNPAHRTDNTSYQECIDTYGTPAPNTVTVRGCWIFHTPARGGDYLLYAKGGSKNILWENNVFGPAYSGPGGNASTSAGGPSPSVYPSCENFIARNNLFLECSGDGAFGLLGVRNCEFYNNVIWGYKGSRAAVEFWTALPGGSKNENFKFKNNIVMNQAQPVFSDRGYMPVAFEHDYNIYYQTGGGGSVNINAEANSLFVDPKLTSPSTPALGADTWASIVARFRPKFNSPAIDAALNLGPLVSLDVLAVPRPFGPAYDIGAYEVLSGDANADGHVDVVDLLILVDAFGAVVGDANYDPTCDFNADGGVDVVDLLYLVDTFGLY